MDDRRDILIALAWRTLIALPLLLAAWFLFDSTRGDAEGSGPRLLGLACVVAAGIVIARPFAALLAEPTGSLFYPRHPARREPGYSRAAAQRQRGQYEDALAEYRKIAAQFPTEVYPYVAMIEIALLNLGDAKRADVIVQRGLATLRDDASRKHLRWMHGRITAKALPLAAPAVPPAPDAQGEADRGEPDPEETS